VRGNVTNVTIGCRTCLTAAGVALAVVPATVAAAAGDAATAALSTNKPGARHVTLTASLRTDLRCGRLIGTAPLTLVLPAKAHIPASVPTFAVLVGGRPAGKVVVTGHSLAISPPPPRGMLCDSIRRGTAKLVLLPAAGLRNPAAAGTYTFRLRHGGDTFALPLHIA
jgi:hypothetical protein